MNSPSTPTATPALATVSIKLRHTSRDATGLVGLLQGVGYIQDDGETEGLHFGDAAIVDD